VAIPVWSSVSAAWKIARKVEGLLELQSKTTIALEAIESRLRSLEDRMTHLEAGQGQIVTEARSAAGAAATALAGSIISDVVTRVTRIEMRQEDSQRRLLPPSPPPTAT
jgi:hypothetical protein